MKFVQVHKLVALCLCLGVLRTGAHNLRPRLLHPRCIKEGGRCGTGGKRNCCEGLNFVGRHSNDGSKTCEKPGAGTKKSIVSVRVNGATMESDDTIAVMGSAYCRKTESISVHHASLVAVKAVLHMTTAAAIYFVIIKSVPCLPSGGGGCAAHGDCCGNLFCHATQCVPCIPPTGYCNIDDDCCYGYFCHASKCVYCLPSGGEGCTGNVDCCDEYPTVCVDHMCVPP